MKKLLLLFIPLVLCFSCNNDNDEIITENNNSTTTQQPVKKPINLVGNYKIVATERHDVNQGWLTNTNSGWFIEFKDNGTFIENSVYAGATQTGTYSINADNNLKMKYTGYAEQGGGAWLPSSNDIPCDVIILYWNPMQTFTIKYFLKKL